MRTGPVRRLVLTLGVAAVAIAAAGQALAQTPVVHHTITGRIEMPSGAALDDRMEVSLRPLLGGGSRVLFSDPGGRFVFEEVRSGNYLVTVHMPKLSGFESGSVEARVDNNPLPSNFFVTVSIRRKEGEPTVTLPGRTIDARESDASIPREARRAYERGVKAAARGKVEEAVQGYREALRIAPEYVYALNDLGVLLTRAGRPAEAVQVLRQAVAIAPSSYPPALNLAIALLDVGKSEEADGYATKAAELDPSAAEAPFVSARAARALGDLERAVVAYERAFHLGGFDLAVAEFELGQTYEELGQREAAARAYATFLTIVDKGPQAETARRRLKALGAG